MNKHEDSTFTLKDCLFTLVSSFNTVLDRLDVLTERQEEFLLKNEEVFKLAREDFFRKLIEAEVNKEMEKNKQSKGRGVKFGSDIVRKARNS